MTAKRTDVLIFGVIVFEQISRFTKLDYLSLLYPLPQAKNIGFRD